MPTLGKSSLRLETSQLEDAGGIKIHLYRAFSQHCVTSVGKFKTYLIDANMDL